jgi:hypothetical protein
MLLQLPVHVGMFGPSLVSRYNVAPVLLVTNIVPTTGRAALTTTIGGLVVEPAVSGPSTVAPKTPMTPTAVAAPTDLSPCAEPRPLRLITFAASARSFVGVLFRWYTCPLVYVQTPHRDCPKGGTELGLALEEKGHRR